VVDFGRRKPCFFCSKAPRELNSIGCADCRETAAELCRKMGITLPRLAWVLAKSVGGTVTFASVDGTLILFSDVETALQVVKALYNDPATREATQLLAPAEVDILDPVLFALKLKLKLAVPAAIAPAATALPQRVTILKPQAMAWARPETAVVVQPPPRRPPMEYPRGTLSMFVLYDHPKDLPDFFVARRWEVKDGAYAPTDEVKTAPTLEMLRLLLPPGLTRLPRAEQDDPCIIEVWL